MFNRIATFAGLFGLLLMLTAADADAQRKKKEKPMAAPSGNLDEGRLDPSWFGGPRVFVETDEIDYFWVADGYELKGKTLHFVEWGDPEFVGPKANDRDENDHRLARQMSSDMARSFADVFNRNYGSELPSSVDEGDIKVEGRIVDCSTGSTAAKALVGFGAGAGNTTIDVRFTDKSTGEVVAGLHHRVVSGTNWSTTDSKFFKWVKKAGGEIAKKGSVKVYSSGSRKKK